MGRRYGALGREGAGRTPRSRSRRCAARPGRPRLSKSSTKFRRKSRSWSGQQRRQRQDIFKAEDEIMEKRDALIDSLERRLAQRTETESLFTIRWAVV